YPKGQTTTHQAGLWCDALRDGEDTWNKLMTSDPPETKSALHLSQTSGGALRCIALLVLCSIGTSSRMFVF
ncbi:MAG: hypothetical protein CVU40_18560, partial [Chloroflexi bacterium HGW-Chloroflexi-2]